MQNQTPLCVQSEINEAEIFKIYNQNNVHKKQLFCMQVQIVKNLYTDETNCDLGLMYM